MEFKEIMNCPICKTGQMAAGKATVTLWRNKTVVIIKGVPADLCDNCGEYYLTAEVTSIVHGLAQPAVNRKAEVEILHYAA